jgi:hypothetical protein
MTSNMLENLQSKARKLRESYQQVEPLNSMRSLHFAYIPQTLLGAESYSPPASFLRIASD